MRLGRTKERGKYTGGRSKSLGDPLKRLCWKCGKAGHFKKNCKSKTLEKGKGSENTSSIENKSSTEGGDI